MAIRHVLAILLASGAVGAAAQETPPLSAIDWLSNSVEEDVVASTNARVVPKATTPETVRVMPLDAPVIDSAGLSDASALELPSDIWGRSSSGDLAAELVRLSPGPEAPPSISRFFAELLVTRLDPPIDAAVDDRLFYARVDRLLEKGHLDDAEALIEATGSEDPQLFRRRFDIALLTGGETKACREIETTPELSPTYPARIFCLARLGQFDVAALTLGNAETLGILTPEEDKLLLFFLDPELFEDEPLPLPPSVPTPLQFRLYEAVGERIPTKGLPVPFAHADMSPDVGWRTRLSAAERLAATGAIPFERLLEVYRERSASASGAVWDRVRAIQSLAAAMEAGDEAELVKCLTKAWDAAKQGGYTAAFAEWIMPAFRKLDDPGTASHLAFEVALTAGDIVAAERFADRSREDRFLLSLAKGEAGAAPAGDAFGRVIVRGLSSLHAGPAFEALIADDRRGEVLFRALDQLAEGADGNPDTTAQSLAALRKIGLDRLARQIAVELVLMEGKA